MQKPKDSTVKMKTSTVKAIYRCLMGDARKLMHTPQFRLRNALQLKQWGIGYFVPPREAEASSGSSEIRSLRDFIRHRDLGFRYEDKDAHANVVEMVRTAFRENKRLKDPRVSVL